MRSACQHKHLQTKLNGFPQQNKVLTHLNFNYRSGFPSANKYEGFQPEELDEFLDSIRESRCDGSHRNRSSDNSAYKR